MLKKPKISIPVRGGLLIQSFKLAGAPWPKVGRIRDLDVEAWLLELPKELAQEYTAAVVEPQGSLRSQGCELEWGLGDQYWFGGVGFSGLQVHEPYSGSQVEFLGSSLW